MVVKDIMTKDVITVTPETSLNAAGKIFKERKISGLPIVSDDGSIVGIITMTDFLRILDRIYEWRELEKSEPELKLSNMFEEEKASAKVKDFMTKTVLTLTEDSSVDEAMKLMFVRGVHTIPVVRDGKLVGVVGKKDVVYACF